MVCIFITRIMITWSETLLCWNMECWRLTFLDTMYVFMIGYWSCCSYLYMFLLLFFPQEQGSFDLWFVELISYLMLLDILALINLTAAWFSHSTWTLICMGYLYLKQIWTCQTLIVVFWLQFLVDEPENSGSIHLQLLLV